MSVSTAVLSSPEASRHHGEELSAIGKTIIQDFYNSFRFSQGNAALQRSIYTALGDFYASHMDQQERETVVRMIPALGQRALRLALPKAHIDKEEAINDAMRGDAADRGITPIAEGFRTEWWNFSTWHLGMLDSPDAADFRLNPDTVETIAAGMIRRDSAYQKKNRPGRPGESDTHMSYFRDYVVLGKPTGSEAFDTIFTQARDMLMNPEDNRVQNSALRLAYEWEAAHPGQSFFTPPEPEA